MATRKKKASKPEPKAKVNPVPEAPAQSTATCGQWPSPTPPDSILVRTTRRYENLLLDRKRIAERIISMQQELRHLDVELLNTRQNLANAENSPMPRLSASDLT